ncbi:unnamed protein product, partial [Closterium sp. NIES-54]
PLQTPRVVSTHRHFASAILRPWYVDDLEIATADTEALALVKSELQKRHTCTDLGELRNNLGLLITHDRAWRTITLTQSHMVHQVLQRFGFKNSSPQSTPLPTGHSLSAPPSDQSVEPSGLYPELVGCLIGVAHKRYNPIRWLTRDAAARLAIRNHLPIAECGHFGQHKTAQALYDAVVARYSSPATAILGRLLLPYLFPKLSAFTTVEDLVSHLRDSDARYRTAVPAEDHFLSLDPTSLAVDLLEQHLLTAETSTVVVGAAHGTPRPPFFEGCSPSPLAPSYASTAATDVSVPEDVGAASASANCRSSKGKGGREWWWGQQWRWWRQWDYWREWGLGWRWWRQRWEWRQWRRWDWRSACRFWGWPALAAAASERDPVSPAALIDIFDLDLLSAMYALSVSAEGDCYRCVPSNPSIAVAALGASESSTLPGTTPVEALHTFTLDCGASRYFFRDSTTLTPLHAPVPVRLADPSGGQVVARSSTVLSCPAVPSGSLSGLHLPSFSTNLVSTTALQDAMVTTTTPGGQRVSICTCTQTGRHLATFTRRPGSSLYTLPTEPSQVAASAQVSASHQVAASCSCRLLSHQTLLWHHRLGHPSLPRLRGMHSRLPVSGLPRSLPPLLPSPAPPCLPCVEGRQRAAPHSSLFPSKTAPLQTLHMDVWGPARVSGQSCERYFLLVVDDYMRYTTVFPLHSKGEVVDVLIPWIRTVCLQLRERFGQDLPFLRLHSDKGDKLSPRAIPRVFLGFVPDARGWHFYHPTSRRVFPSQDVTFDKSVPFYHLFSYRSPPPLPPPLFLAPGPPPIDPLPPQGPSPSGVSQVDPLLGPAPVQVAVDYGAALGVASGGAKLGGAESEGAETGGAEPGGTGGAEPGGVAIGSGEPGGAVPEGAEPGGTTSEGAESGGAEPQGAASSGASGAGGAGAAGVGVTGGTATTGPGGARTRGTGAAGTSGVEGAGAGDLTGSGTTGASSAGAGGAGVGGPGAEGAGVGGPGVGGAGAGGEGVVDPGGTLQPRPYFPASPLPALSPSPSHPVSPVRTVRRVPRLRPPPVPGMSAMTLRPSSVPLRVPLPDPPEFSFPEDPDPESDRGCAASPTVSRLVATGVTDPSFESAVASALVAEVLDLAAACRLDYATALAAESASAIPPSVRGECTLGTDVLEDRQEDFDCLAAAVPRFASMLLAPEGDPDAPDIQTPRSYALAITGPYSSQWQAAMDAEMASWKSTGTYVDGVPPPGANIVDGMWIFRVKRPPGSPPSFKAHYVARGFSQQQGVDYFQTFSPTPKMTTLRVLLHVAAQRDYKLHSLDFSTAFLQGSLHEEIWLRRPPGFTESFPAGTQWSLRRPVYGLREAPREWHDTLRTTLAALGFAPAIADLSLYLRADTSLPPFYNLVYVSDLVFATADTEALTLVKSELQKRHTCTDLGELCSYLGLQITRDRARRTITLTQSHMVHQVLQRFGFQFSSPQPTPLSTSHSLSAPPSDDSVVPSGPYPALVGCLKYLMTCTRPDLAYPLSLLARYVAPGRHRKELRWLTYLLTDFGEQPPVLYVDNKAMIALCQEHRLEHRTKHIALRYFLARDLQQRGQHRLVYVATRANTADIFTKALPPGDHQRFSTVLGLMPTLPHLLTA